MSSGSDRLVDEYAAAKGRWSRKVSAFERHLDGYTVVSLKGLNADEFKALNCPTVAQEEAGLTPEQSVEKRYREEITTQLTGSPQPAGENWLELLPAPQFFPSLDTQLEPPHRYDTPDSVFVKFVDIPLGALEDYLATLA